MKTGPRSDAFPALPLAEWEDTYDTLHLYLQIIGKIRLKLFPKKNHWWHVPFTVSTRGLTTGPIPHGAFTFEMEFDLSDHVFTIRTSRGVTKTIPLQNGLSVSKFYQQVFAFLDDLGIAVKILAVPYDLPDISTDPFASIEQYASYDPDHAHRFWQVLVRIDSLFQVFRGRFIGKSTPPHLFWHHFDLALTRFSGRPAPVRAGANIVEREAYSHEVISFGFWAGDKQVREPAFYAYAHPAPLDMMDEPLQPDNARWNPDAGMAFYRYQDMRKAPDPGQALLAFLESAYQAGARTAGWDIKAFALEK